jgi:hypothetical protein
VGELAVSGLLVLRSHILKKNLYHSVLNLGRGRCSGTVATSNFFDSFC